MSPFRHRLSRSERRVYHGRGVNARKLIVAGLLLLLAGACIFMLLPLESYWPGALPYAELSGRLDGRPV